MNNWLPGAEPAGPALPMGSLSLCAQVALLLEGGSALLRSKSDIQSYHALLFICF